LGLFIVQTIELWPHIVYAKDIKENKKPKAHANSTQTKKIIVRSMREKGTGEAKLT